MDQILDYDVAIIGTGIAGILCALNLDQKLRIALVSNGSFEDTNSYLAQGGVAAPVGVGDSIESHIEDTIRCGYGFNNRKAVTQIVREADKVIDQIIGYGVEFDTHENGSFMLGREGAHSCARILRIGDYTGRAIMETLWAQLLGRANIDVMTHTQIVEMTLKAPIKTLIAVKDEPFMIQTECVVIATGGLGRLYRNTSNNPLAKGEGIALALKEGVKTQHLNWVQFHPTVFHNLNGYQEGFLISEAVRGEGAILRNQALERFMLSEHEMAELAPRDVVSKGILREIRRQVNPYVWLDVRHIGCKTIAKQFPTIYEYCKGQGLDLERDMIPVSPGAHYLMGGISTDLFGETSFKNVFAIGECAYTGAHGKNRLASNSLLEAMVFATKAAEKINQTPISKPKELVREIASEVSSGIQNIDLYEWSRWMDINMGIDRNKVAINEKFESLNANHSASNIEILIKEMLKQELEA